MKRMIDEKLINEINSKLTDGFSGDNASTKKIYYHPVSSFGTTAGHEYAISMSILNNDPTPFTDVTFIAWLKNLIDTIENNVAVINISGGYESCTSCAYMYCNKSGGTYNAIFIGFDKDGNYTQLATILVDNIFNYSAAFRDGVNAIN